MSSLGDSLTGMPLVKIFRGVILFVVASVLSFGVGMSVPEANFALRCMFAVAITLLWERLTFGDSFWQEVEVEDDLA